MEAKRISLSYKATLDNPWDKIKIKLDKKQNKNFKYN